MKNALVFAQIEGQQNLKSQENEAPEPQKCCRGRKFTLAAFENACLAISDQGHVLYTEKAPKTAFRHAL